jgi:sirohydrochlorin ferrochelatase
MRRFAAMRAEADVDFVVETAFLAMAKPSFDEQLQKVAEGGFQKVIVQPHFLFAGELVERIWGQTFEMARKYPETDWIVAAPLADPPGEAGLANELLTKVILSRLREAGIRVVVSPGDD